MYEPLFTAISYHTVNDKPDFQYREIDFREQVN